MILDTGIGGSVRILLTIAGMGTVVEPFFTNYMEVPEIDMEMVSSIGGS